ncbi:DUF262 domain-containing protein [Vibrio owensii]|uniref:DUF262 domain-containing protein n=1 Tax=Vibrio harveyi group TaxID=717610 RepID=UPI003CC5C47B
MESRHKRNKNVDQALAGKIKSLIANSPWGVSSAYQVTVETGRFVDNLAFYHEAYASDKWDDYWLLGSMQPEFQRDNDKWSQQMQIQFVENILCGCPTKILLYTLKEDDFSQCFMLDGQQRSYSLVDWMNGKFKVFDCYFSEINHRAVMGHGRISIEIYNFKSHVEACEFYIKMNRGITHSDKDIERALNYIAMNAA